MSKLDKYKQNLVEIENKILNQPNLRLTGTLANIFSEREKLLLFGYHQRKLTSSKRWFTQGDTNSRYFHFIIEK